ncbi:phage tail tape measure protein [Agrobacterium pusense]|uniref:phage tail tape measure protein n=1 Tax=Agrobacterium pusense TaxID=648995 RepID=UPI000D19D015|nr:phage tail tape measure protein [Agrobacterium pusense]
MANDAILYTRMEVRLSEAEKKLKRFENNVDKNMSNVERSSRRAARTMETSFAASAAKIGSVFKSFGAGLLAGVAGGGVGFLAVAKDITSSVAELGAEAEKAGLSFKAFQELKYVADQAKIPVDAITDGLKELSLRADEFAVTGKGSAAEAFQRLGLTPQEVKEKLKNPTELLLLLIERTRQLKDTAAGVRIFDELFGGTGGERMVSLINQGEAGIRAQIKAANDFGHVLSDDIIIKAREIDQQFNNIASTVGTTLKSAVVSVVASMVDFLDGLRTIDKQRSQTIQNSINDIMAQKQAVAKAIADIDAADNRMNDRQKNRAKGTHQITMQQLNERENALIRELENRPSVMNFTPQNSGAWTPPKYTPPPPAKTGSSTRDTSTAELERERKAVKDLLADLQLEYDMIGKTEVQKAKMNALRQAGAAATSDEQLAIMQKVDAIYRETDAYDRAQEAAREANDAARDFAGTLVDGMLNGATAVETLGNALRNLASRLIDSGLDALFGGGKAGAGAGAMFGSVIKMRFAA